MTRPTPTDLTEVMRDVRRRLTDLENPQAVRVGPYVLTARDGALVVSDGTGSQAVLAGEGAGQLILPTPAEIGAVSTADIKLSIDPPPAGGGPLSFITDLLTGKWLGISTAQTTGEAAQTTGNNNAVGLAILNSRVDGGFSDTFSRDGADLGPDYFIDYGAGSGTVGTTTANAGSTIWTPSGYDDRSFAAINTAHPMATNRMRVSLVIDQFVWTPTSNQSLIYLVARSDITQDNAVVALLGNINSSFGGSAEIGHVVAGVYTRLGSAVPITTGQGDLWDLECGVVGGSDLEFNLVQNNAVVANETDSLAASQIGAGFEYVGFGGNCYIGAGAFGTTYQGAMPNVQVLAGADF